MFAKYIKKVLVFAILISSFALVGCSEEEDSGSLVLRVYNCQDYIDEGLDDVGNKVSTSVMEDWADDYYERTGKRVEVVYDTFETNETMLNTVKKEYDNNVVVDDFNLYVRKGEFVTFLGPSGCGKTTTLRMIAGFEMPTEGKIYLNGVDITDLPPYKRPINTVFQRYALFPHLDVYDNVAFGLKLKKVEDTKTQKDGTKKTVLRKLTRKEIDTKVMEALKIVDLEEFETRDITTLSGGQQQRVAIARAIVNEPEILLLDEPLGALDLKMRKDMQLELKEMHKKLGITFIYVTHDQEEALTMSDTIVVMKDGMIQQIGSPTDIYNEPKNAFVADFIGESNIYNGTITGEHKVIFLNHEFEMVDDFEYLRCCILLLRSKDW